LITKLGQALQSANPWAQPKIMQDWAIPKELMLWSSLKKLFQWEC